MEVSKFLYFVLVQFQFDAIYSNDPRFCFMISLLTAYFIVYILYWSIVKSR